MNNLPSGPETGYRTSIILLTYNNLAYTRLCLDSLYAKTGGADFEVVVVDNASEDQTAQYLSEQKNNCPNLTAILNSENKGIAAGFNAGVAASKGEFIVFLHNDTVVTEGWLERLLSPLANPLVGMVSPVTNKAKGCCRIQVSYDALEDIETFARNYIKDPSRKLIEVDKLPLFCAALRRSVFEQIGTFDERFRPGRFEDEDYSMRLRQHGYKLLCTEKVYIHHWGGAGFKLLDFETRWTNFKENRARFENKWQIRWNPPRFRDEFLDDQLRDEIDEKIGLATEIIELKHEVARLSEMLTDTYQSKGWTFLKWLRKLQGWIIPPNSSRAEITKILWKPIGYLFGKASYGISSYRQNRRSKQDANTLTSILDLHKSVQEIIVFAPTVPWNVSLFQRPHQLALAFTRLDRLVFFCEPSYSNSFHPGIDRINNHLYVVGEVSPGVLKQIRSPVIFTVAYNTEAPSVYSDPLTIYEFIDELEVFQGNTAEYFEAHNKMLLTADLVIATADKLLNKVNPFRPDALLVPNGVDYEFIRSVIERTSEPPVELGPLIQENKPIIGYYGALADWFDYGMLYAVAENRPDYIFLLIGPDYDGSFHSSLLEELHNVHWLNAKPYAELPSYLKYFDVAIIPFVLNEITHATSPIKLFEYMTAGKPIVTTAMHECQKYPIVSIAQDAQDFALKLDAALELARDAEFQQKAVDTAKENTWDQRAQVILKALSDMKQAPRQSIH